MGFHRIFTETAPETPRYENATYVEYFGCCIPIPTHAYSDLVHSSSLPWRGVVRNVQEYPHSTNILLSAGYFFMSIWSTSSENCRKTRFLIDMGVAGELFELCVMYHAKMTKSHINLTVEHPPLYKSYWKVAWSYLTSKKSWVLFPPQKNAPMLKGNPFTTTEKYDIHVYNP